MLKKNFKRKIIITTAILFSFFLVKLLPKTKNIEVLEYKSDYKMQAIYLIDKNERLARTLVPFIDDDIISMSKRTIELLTINSKLSDQIEKGFKAVIPEKIKINNIEFNNNILKIDFSKELLNTDIELKVIESLVYSLTEIEEVKKIIIYIDGDILTKLPKSKINLPSHLDRSIGINKTYNLTTYKDVNPVTIYYISKNDDDYYYVPVTKYVNDKKDKIKIIVEELSSSPVIDTNLMSFLNSNVKLLASLEEVNTLFLTFNEYIFSDMDSKNILEEVIYSISLSVKDNYDVSKVSFNTKEEEICKTTLKSLE